MSLLGSPPGVVPSLDHLMAMELTDNISRGSRPHYTWLPMKLEYGFSLFSWNDCNNMICSWSISKLCWSVSSKHITVEIKPQLLYNRNKKQFVCIQNYSNCTGNCVYIIKPCFYSINRLISFLHRLWKMIQFIFELSIYMESKRWKWNPEQGVADLM